MLKNHQFHLVNNSPWPLIKSMSTMTMLTGTVKLFNLNSTNLFFLGFFLVILSMYQWWRDTMRESTFQGLHTSQVFTGLKLGMILFIISELFFFISFFWTFFHSSLSPTMELGLTWPPIGIMIFNPFQIPLLNTIILLTSGISVTWAHHSLLNNNYMKTLKSLFFTISLGIYFTILQGYEYFNAPFSFNDSIYGSTFFMATGFHGIHVLIGTIFLMVCFFRHKNFHFSNSHHFSFEAATWYWHFVDIIWLILYLSIYWWGK